MSIEMLKQELSSLSLVEQRQLVAYLVALQEEQNTAYRDRLAQKIDDREPSHFATLKELERRSSRGR